MAVDGPYMSPRVPGFFQNIPNPFLPPTVKFPVSGLLRPCPTISDIRKEFY